MVYFASLRACSQSDTFVDICSSHSANWSSRLSFMFCRPALSSLISAETTLRRVLRTLY